MAMDFKGARDRMRSLIAAKKPNQLSESALAPDKLRDNVIAETEQASERFRASLEDVPSVSYEALNEDGTNEVREYEWSTFPEALRDVARAAYGWDEPTLRPHEEIKPSHQFNRAVEAHILADKNFTDSRPYTRNNEVESICSAQAMSDVMREKAHEVAEHIARSEQMREAENEVQSADDLFDNLRQQAREEIDDQGAVQDPTKRAIKRAMKQSQAAHQALADLIQQHAGSNYVQAAAALAQAAAQAGGQTVEALSSLPGTDPGSARKLPADKQIELAKKWTSNPDLRQIARMLGRLQRDLRFRREARTRNVPIEPVGVTTGRDISRLLPQEYARAYDPTLRPLFIKDYANRSLLEYEMEGKVPSGKGPIICVHDGSYSMDEDFGGCARWVWASSLALALCTVANREKRDFAGIEFGSAGELETWIFRGSEPLDPDDLLDYAGHFFGGGTDIESGMSEALRIIEDAPAFKTADVILITDGEDTYTKDDQAIHDKLVGLNVRIHGVAIDMHDASYMRQMCEYVVDVADLAESENAQRAIAENLT